jgi:hypothetical protein
MIKMTVHKGSCHCGAVRFEVNAEIRELTRCDCSLCVKRNAVMAQVPSSSLVVVEGEAMLALYEWNTRRAKHHFCRVCGIYVFHKKRSAPDHYGVNVFCLDGFDAKALPVHAAEGATMTIEDPGARPDLPGPRPAA